MTRTSTDGYFYFADLPDGNYTLTFSLPHKGTRYGTTSYQTSVVRDTKGNIDRSINSENHGILKIFLMPTTLKGNIKDDAGNPIANAKVKIEGTQESTISNSAGEYRFTQLELPSSDSNQGQITLSVSAHIYSPITKIATIEKGQIINLDFTLSITNKE